MLLRQDESDFFHRKRLDQLDDLPTVPHTRQRVLTEIEEVSSSAQNLQAIIEQDPVLTAKILGLDVETGKQIAQQRQDEKENIIGSRGEIFS